MTQALLVFLGAAGTVVAALIAVVAVRKRTGSETVENEANAAGILTQGAVSLVPYFQSRMADYEHRLTLGEAATLAAQQTANANREALNAAREAEHRCLARLDAMQAQLDAIQVRQDHPPQSTTVTTAVTTVAPADHIDPPAV